MIKEMASDADIKSDIQTRIALGVLGNWNLDGVRQRAASRLGWSKRFAKRVEIEYKKFISLSVMFPNRDYGLSGPVDEFWHEHILCTLDYQRMCLDVAGSFIHHAVAEESGVPNASGVKGTIDDLSKIYRNIDLEIWPAVTERAICAACHKIENIGDKVAD